MPQNARRTTPQPPAVDARQRWERVHADWHGHVSFVALEGAEVVVGDRFTDERFTKTYACPVEAFAAGCFHDTIAREHGEQVVEALLRLLSARGLIDAPASAAPRPASTASAAAPSPAPAGARSPEPVAPRATKQGGKAPTTSPVERTPAPRAVSAQRDQAQRRAALRAVAQDATQRKGVVIRRRR